MTRFPPHLRSSPFGRRLATAAASCVGIVGLSGCGSMVPRTTEGAQIRFVHTSPDAPSVDFYINGNGTAYNLNFGTVTSYIPVNPGEVKISAASAGSAQTLATTRSTLDGTRQYTAVLRNSLGSLGEAVYADATAPAPAGMLALRVLNEAADLGPVDVYLLPGGVSGPAAPPTLRDLSFGNTEGYTNLPAEKVYTVVVLPTGTAPGVSAFPSLPGVSVSGGSGAVRTLVLSDAPGTKGKGLRGFVLDDIDTP